LGAGRGPWSTCLSVMLTKAPQRDQVDLGETMLTHICISDLHIGSPTSLLTSPPNTFRATPEPVAATFATALGHMLKQSGSTPQLMLLGDVLDLQFANRSEAYQKALSFLTTLKDTGQIAGTVMATAGNHDHALWTDARLSLETDTFSNHPHAPEYRKSTPAFSQTPAAQSRLLHELVTKAGFDDVDFRYPNIGFAGNNRAVVFHHGHFVETPYRLMSTLKDAISERDPDLMTVDRISSENAGWIDFFWSTTGDAGFGRDFSDFYQNMLTTTGYRRLSAKMAVQIRDALANIVPMAGNLTVQEVLRMSAQVGLDLTLGKFRDTERYAVVLTLTEDGYDGVRYYLNGPVKTQITSELNAIHGDVTFVFGHTHKPFSERIATDGFAQPVKTYNTGGWTLNGPGFDNAEGAAMVLMDDKYNVAALRLFTTPHAGTVPIAKVEMLVDNEDGAAFRDEIKAWIAAPGNHWAALAGAARDAYVARQSYLLKLTAPEASDV